MASSSFGPQVGKMAKIHYIVEFHPDYVQGYFFNNKRKAIEKGMEEVEGFEFGNEIENEETDAFFHSGVLNSNSGFLFWMEDGDWDIEEMDSDVAKGKIESGEIEENSAGAYFPAKLKTGYGECYIGSATEHTNGKWSFEFGDIYEKKQKQTTMKYVPTFESFVNEYSTIVDSNKMLKALKKAVKAADSFEEIGAELDALDYKKDYKWEFVDDFKGTDVGGHPAYIITYLQGTRHAIADPGFWKNSSSIEDKVGDLAIGWILGR